MAGYHTPALRFGQPTPYGRWASPIRQINSAWRFPLQLCCRWLKPQVVPMRSPAAHLSAPPWHLLADLPERPAMVYVNDLPYFENKAYCFGGGFVPAIPQPIGGRPSLPPVLLGSHAFVGSGPQPSLIKAPRRTCGFLSLAAPLTQRIITRRPLMPEKNAASGKPPYLASGPGLYHAGTNVAGSAAFLATSPGGACLTGLTTQADEKGYPVAGFR